MNVLQCQSEEADAARDFADKEIGLLQSQLHQTETMLKAKEDELTGLKRDWGVDIARYETDIRKWESESVNSGLVISTQREELQENQRALEVLREECEGLRVRCDQAEVALPVLQKQSREVIQR